MDITTKITDGSIEDFLRQECGENADKLIEHLNEHKGHLAQVEKKFGGFVVSYVDLSFCSFFDPQTGAISTVDEGEGL